MLADLPPGWTEYTSPEGRIYYHHGESGTSQWDRPTVAQLSGNISMPPAEKAATPQISATSFFIDYASKYFNISTKDIRKRLTEATLPYRLLGAQDDQATDTIKNNPDLYGPFWICVTVAFSLFMGTHAYSWASDALMDTHYMILYSSLVTTFTFWLLPPILVRLLLVFSGSPAEIFALGHIICLQGYSLLPIIPMSILCTIPIKLVQVLLVMLALGLSLSYIMINILSDLSQVNKRSRVTVVAILFGCQTIHFLLFPTYFFRLPQFSSALTSREESVI